MRFRPLLARDQDVLLALRFLDAVVELAQRHLQAVGLFPVFDPRLVQADVVLGVLVVPQQRLLGEVVAPFLHRQHGALLPVFGEFLLLLGLGREPLLVRDRRRHLLLGFRQLGAHVDDQLVEHFFRVLGARDQVVDVRPDQRRETVKDPHTASRNGGGRSRPRALQVLGEI